MEDFWSPIQGIIRETCSNFDKTWQIRRRVIDTNFLVLFIFKLVLSKNRQGYASLLNELWEKPELAGHQEKPVSASSLCEARQKLPEDVFIQINQAILAYQAEVLTTRRWCGHRIFAADGSKINLPHELLLAGYKAPNQGQYYPQGLMSVIYDLGSGFVHDFVLSPDKSERYCIIRQMDTLSQGDVLVLDRGYFSYLILDQALEKNIHLICRLSSGSMNWAVEAFWNSDLNDAVIDYSPSAAVKSEIKKQGHDLNYKPIKLRLIKYKIAEEIYICATTLIGECYPLDEFPLVYHGRWGIEELYKVSKEFIDVEDFHGKSERGVKQELYAHALLINIARIFAAEAHKQLPPPSLSEDKYMGKESDTVKSSHWEDLFNGLQKLRVNFKNCLLVIGRFIEKIMLSLGLGEEKKKEGWLSKIVEGISRVRQKIRPGRHYPRCSRKPYNRWKSSNASKVLKTG